MLRIPSRQKITIHNSLHQYRVDFWNSINSILNNVLGHGNLIPSSVQRYYDDLIALNSRVGEWNAEAGDLEINDTETALLRVAIVQTRLREARFAEARSSKTFDPELLDKIGERLAELDTVINSDWFTKAAIKIAPRITDFIPVEFVEKWQRSQVYNQVRDVERNFDEKFHLLWAPTLFFTDLETFRTAAVLRNVSFAVAFLDIDNFKLFNQKYTEPTVDRDLLPRFMGCLEAHVFGRGAAYRQGGDEYVLLLYNSTADDALKSMNELRLKLSSLSYRGISERTTVSIGLVCVDCDSHFTDRELLLKASAAKAFAKSKGKDRVSTFCSSLLKEEDIR